MCARTNDDAVLDRVIEIVAEVLETDPQTVAPGSRLINDLGADSVDFLSVASKLAAEFQIDFSVSQLFREANAACVGSPADPLAARRSLEEFLTTSLDESEVRLLEKALRTNGARAGTEALPYLLTPERIAARVTKLRGGARG